MTDEQQIRDLIQRWAVAVHDGDMATVLADHAPNIVMFDVSPPQRGVRGLDAYRDTWPGFFEWHRLTTDGLSRTNTTHSRTRPDRPTSLGPRPRSCTSTTSGAPSRCAGLWSAGLHTTQVMNLAEHQV
jgi:hypothetical protein